MLNNRMRTLGDVAVVVMGQSPPGENCNRQGRGLPLLNGPTEFGHSHPLPSQFTTDARKVSQAGDLLFCVRGSTTGRMNWADQIYAIGRGIAAIRHRSNCELQPLIRAAVEWNLNNLLQSATGSTFPNVSAAQLGTVPYPALEPEDEIEASRLLGALDDKIELNRRINETLEAMAQAIFKDWFVDFGPTRAKIEGSPPYLAPEVWALFPDTLENSEVGEVPRGWAFDRLGSLVDLVRGTTYNGALKDLAGPVLLGLASIERNGGFRGDKLATYGGTSNPKHLLVPGDLFVSLKDVTQSADLLGAIARVPETVKCGRLTQDTVKLVFQTPSASKALVYQSLLEPTYRDYCRRHATGTTNLGLARDDFLAYPIVRPSEEVRAVQFSIL